MFHILRFTCMRTSEYQEWGVRTRRCRRPLGRGLGDQDPEETHPHRETFTLYTFVLRAFKYIFYSKNKCPKISGKKRKKTEPAEFIGMDPFWGFSREAHSARSPVLPPSLAIDRDQPWGSQDLPCKTLQDSALCAPSSPALPLGGRQKGSLWAHCVLHCTGRVSSAEIPPRPTGMEPGLPLRLGWPPP